MYFVFFRALAASILKPGAFILESVSKIGVHVAGDSFNILHPVHSDMSDEVIDNLLAFALGDPEHMSGLQINDMGGIPSAVMELKLVNAKVFRGLLRPFEFLAADGVFFLEALLVNVLDHILPEACDIRHILQGVGAVLKQIPGIPLKLLGDTMSFGFEQDCLHPGLFTGGAQELNPWKDNPAQGTANIQMSELRGERVVDDHTTTASADPIILWKIQFAHKAVYIPPGAGFLLYGFRVVKPEQQRRNLKKLRFLNTFRLNLSAGERIIHVRGSPL